MRSRLLTLLVVILLAVPAPAVLPPVQDGLQHQKLSAPTFAAKKKSKKGKPRFKTVRQSVTQTFTSAGGMTINDNTTATPYPSPINVAGFTNGIITDVNLLLNGFSHTWPDDVDILLAPLHLPSQNAILLSDIGGGDDAVSLNLTLDDQAAATLPAAALASGTFRPTNEVGLDGAIDSFPTQTPSGNSLLSVFNGINPNGTWQLFVQDDTTGEVGSIASWALQMTAEADVRERVKGKNKKKGKGRR